LRINNHESARWSIPHSKLAAALHSYCLIAMFFQSPGGVLMHLAEG